MAGKPPPAYTEYTTYVIRLELVIQHEFQNTSNTFHLFNTKIAALPWVRPVTSTSFNPHVQNSRSSGPNAPAVFFAERLPHTHPGTVRHLAYTLNGVTGGIAMASIRGCGHCMPAGMDGCYAAWRGWRSMQVGWMDGWMDGWIHL